MSISPVCYYVYYSHEYFDLLNSKFLFDFYFVDAYYSTTLDGSPSVIIDHAILMNKSHSWLLSDLYSHSSPAPPLPIIFHNLDVAYNYTQGIIDLPEALFQDFTLSFPLVSPAFKTMSPSDSITI